MSAGFRPRLVDALRERPSPVLFTDGGAIPAASLWIGSRLWVNAFRAAGLRRGDRVVLALPPGAAFVEVLVAALWEGLTVAPTKPGEDLGALLDALDAAIAVVPTPADPTEPLPTGVWGADGCSGPNERLAPPRRTTSPRTPEAALLLRTSGTTGRPRWIALSERNVCSVLDSHQPRLALADAYVVSVLPWHHAFGLILDLLPALLAGAYIVRDPLAGRSPETLAELLRQAPAVLCAVPATFAALAALADGPALLQGLAGGIVGGASADAALAERLAGTALRPGYGQTEASPGIALGEPGRWQARLLGRPLGCEVRVVDGILEFRGQNACLGTWEVPTPYIGGGSGGLHVLEAGRWVSTGDSVDMVGGELFFRGRVADRFKLANGRWVETAVLEPRVRAALPQATEVILFTADGLSLDVLVVRPSGALLSGASIDGPSIDGVVRRALGPIGALVGRIEFRTPEAVPQDGKGAVDRAATVRGLLG